MEVFTTTSHVNGGSVVEMAFGGVLTVSCVYDSFHFNSVQKVGTPFAGIIPNVLLRMTAY